MTKKLKIYTDKRYYCPEKELTFLLHPWVNEFGLSIHCHNTTLNQYIQNASTYFERTSLEACDIAVAPCFWREDQSNQEIFELAKAAKSLDKKILIFDFSDSEAKIPIDNTLIFRTSLSRSTRAANEFAMPALFPNLLDVWQETWQPRKKEKIPTVGFCGNVDNRAQETNPIKRFFKKIGYALMARPSLAKFLEYIGITITKHKGRKLRTQLLHIFGKSDVVKTNFLVRGFFNNGIHNAPVQKREAIQVKSKQEYITNTLESDYILAPRGGGNFSYRFYETLSLGRIPIFLNTDCILPFEEFINWKDYCIWVEEAELAQAPKISAKHYQMTSEADFIKKQKACIDLWKTWLSYDGFHKNLWRYLK